jgi:hypothetical protein
MLKEMHEHNMGSAHTRGNCRDSTRVDSPWNAFRFVQYSLLETIIKKSKGDIHHNSETVVRVRVIRHWDNK